MNSEGGVILLVDNSPNLRTVKRERERESWGRLKNV